MFHKLFQFQGSINGWIPNRSLMPDYGQLGCSGFIVLDGKGKCASRKTLSLLQHGPEAAFADLEKLLLKLVSLTTAAIPSSYGYEVGSILLLDGISSEPSLNGRKVCVEGFITATGRFSVRLVGEERTLAVKPCTLAPLGRGEEMPTSLHASAGEGQAPLSQIEKPGLTGCAAIDAEHADCTAALNALLAAPTSTAALENALAALSSHFAHEEEILRAQKFGEGGNGGAFSAMEGHAQDHARILDIARAELSACSSGSGTCRADASAALAQAFVAHAQNFDALFEGKVPTEAR
jgi:hypothetical protein